MEGWPWVEREECSQKGLSEVVLVVFSAALI